MLSDFLNSHADCVTLHWLFWVAAGYVIFKIFDKALWEYFIYSFGIFRRHYRPR